MHQRERLQPPVEGRPAAHERRAPFLVRRDRDDRDPCDGDDRRGGERRAPPGPERYERERKTARGHRRRPVEPLRDGGADRRADVVGAADECGRQPEPGDEPHPDRKPRLAPAEAGSRGERDDDESRHADLAGAVAVAEPADRYLHERMRQDERGREQPDDREPDAVRASRSAARSHRRSRCSSRRSQRARVLRPPPAAALRRHSPAELRAAAVGACLAPVAAELHGAPRRRAIGRAVVERPAAVAARLQPHPASVEHRAERNADDLRKRIGCVDPHAVPGEPKGEASCVRIDLRALRPTTSANRRCSRARAARRASRSRRARSRPSTLMPCSSSQSGSQSTSLCRSTLFRKSCTRRSGSGAACGRS